MSLVGNKDVDYLLCLQLNDTDLHSFCRINKYYYNLYNKEELWKRKIYKFGITEHLNKERLGKMYYFELKRFSLPDADFVFAIFEAICQERADILALFFLRLDINPNFNFILDKKYPQNSTKNYSSKFYNPNYPSAYYPIVLIAKSGSGTMWNVLKASKYRLELNNGIAIMVISSQNYDILKDIIELGLVVTYWVLLFAIRSYNEKATKILLEHVNDDITNEILDMMLIDNNSEYLTWLKVINPAFALFIQDTKVQKNLKFFHTVGQGQEDFIKLLELYNLMN